MNAIDVLKQSTDMSHQMFLGLAEDLRDHPMHRVCDGANHALWTVGHMATALARFRSIIYGKPNPYEDWRALFGGGTKPSDDASIYPPYDKLIQTYKQEWAKYTADYQTMKESDLDKPVLGSPPPGMEALMGTFGSCLLIVSIHPWHHRGQLADIRCSLGKDKLFI
ncbi:MAG: DinB family protein [Phycisphaerales bacterium]